jgi:LysM repeat protein
MVGSALVLAVALFSVDYTVQRGDTLGRIARDNDISLSELIQANNISNPNLIYPGQKLTIPGTEEVYTVAFGDTLGRIAKSGGCGDRVLPQRRIVRVRPRRADAHPSTGGGDGHGRGRGRRALP